jgi:hypothetical protein
VSLLISDHFWGLLSLYPLGNGVLPHRVKQVVHEAHQLPQGMARLKMPGASGGPTSPFIYLHDMVLKHAETVPSPDKEVFTA